MQLLLNTKEKIKNKYGDNCLPDFSYEDNLPIPLKKDLVTKFYESDKIKALLNKIKEEKESKNN